MAASLIPFIRSQLAPDYPKGDSFAWLSDLSWRGPVVVRTSQIDQTTGPTEWSLARNDRVKLAHEARLVRSGSEKPVLLVKTPGSSKMFALNGHSRIIVSARMNRPVKAIIGTASAVHGPWDKHRSSSHKEVTSSAGHDDIIDLAYAYGSGPGGSFNPSLHPRAYHGRFGQTTGGQRPQAASQRGGNDPEDQALRQRAAALRSQAKGLRRQARVLLRQASTILHPPKNPARSAAAKKAAATRRAKGITAFAPTGKAGAGTKTSKTATLRQSTANSLTTQAAKLMRQAQVLDVQANQLDQQALT